MDRGTLSELLAIVEGETLKGEFMVVIGGAEPGNVKREA